MLSLRGFCFVWFWLALPLGFARAQPAPLGKLIDVGGYRVHLYCTGSGSPTVIVVGGGFSFDWGLVQPQVAKFARICTYDPSGTAWSEAAPSPSNCGSRVEEIHKLLQSASVEGPYVLVGFSIGSLYARLYAHDYPKEVAGVVIVDHAFIDTEENSSPNPAAGPLSHAQVDSPPVLISKTPLTLGVEDDNNFKNLPRRDQDLHLWAMSQNPVRPTPEAAAECFTAVDSATRATSHPLASLPLIVISTNYDSPNYTRLQKELLSLSRNSRQMIAENSSHMVIVDQPEIIAKAIREVVISVRNRAGAVH